jgi:large subunit ribosomal protein L25
VPILAKGEAEGAKEGGLLEHILWEIEVECLPTQIPENIPVDISALKIGDSILIRNLQVPPEVKILADPEATVVSLAVPHAEEEVEVKPGEEAVEPEVIMEKKPEEEEAPAEEAKGKGPEKEK